MQKNARADRNEFVLRASQSAATQKENVSRRACDLPEQNSLERTLVATPLQSSSPRQRKAPCWPTVAGRLPWWHPFHAETGVTHQRRAPHAMGSGGCALDRSLWRPRQWGARVLLFGWPLPASAGRLKARHVSGAPTGLTAEARGL